MRLTRIPGERRVYAIRDIGTLRLTGWGSRTAIAEGGGLSWQLAHHGIWQSVFQAADASGDIVGDFRGRTLHHGGVLVWSDRALDLRPYGSWAAHYLLAEAGRPLATIESAGGWGTRPVQINLGAPDATDPGLLLFAVFVVVTLAPHGQPAAAAAA